MGATFSEVKRLARRANYADNRRTMFFSSRVSIYITWLLAGTRVTANCVTYIFSAVGILASAACYYPTYWGPLLGFALYRFHVILDVVDGELARYRKTCSPIGAYIDFVTHYVVYTTVSFGLGVHYYLTNGDVAGVFFGFAISSGLMLNLASKDSWYRANYGNNAPVEGKDKMWSHSWLTLAAVRLCSINTVWFLYAASSLAARFGIDTPTDRGAAWFVLATYSALLPAFALTRIVITAKTRKIPRRAAWYE